MQFALNLPVEFRRLGAEPWFFGYTEKMGSTEVLFRAEEWIEPRSRIEMVFRMPVPDPCNLVCTGTVLRVDLPSTADVLPSIVATIEQYSFVRL